MGGDATARGTKLTSPRRLDGIDVAVILGSGMGDAVGILEDAEALLHKQIGFVAPSAPGHLGTVHIGTVAAKRVATFAGRVHLYDSGVSSADVIAPVEAAAEAGASTLIVTNAAGAIGDALAIGDLCLISDHINMTGSNPLAGKTGGATFVDMTDAYSPRLRELARAIEPGLPEGVYAGVLGPSYETPAEIRMLARVGADLVGMSTVHEVIAARALGLQVLGISLVTNRAAGLGGEPLTHSDVLARAAEGSTKLQALLRTFIEEL